MLQPPPSGKLTRVRWRDWDWAAGALPVQGTRSSTRDSAGISCQHLVAQCKAGKGGIGADGIMVGEIALKLGRAHWYWRCFFRNMSMIDIIGLGEGEGPTRGTSAAWGTLKLPNLKLLSVSFPFNLYSFMCCGTSVG